MKIFPGSPVFSAFDRIRAADSSGDALKRDGQSPGQDTNARSDDSETDPEAEAKVFAATLELAKDDGIAAHGLKPEVQGNGPGLRVTLKDGRGAVVRQFTGEEFLRLRDAATGSRGKLLDKKL